jgi:hypothetical protein
LKLKDFKPVPQGDGQTLSVQAQAGQYFKTTAYLLQNLGCLAQDLQL